MVKTRLLCEPVGPPSGLNTTAAANAAASIPGFDRMTTRAQYEAMMEQGEACKACHATFMPLGFAFGRYDALGRLRTVQRDQVVDPAVRGVPFLGATRDFADGLALSDALSAREEVAACFVKNVVAFVTGLGSAPSVEVLAAAIDAGAAGPVRILGALEDAVVAAALAPRSAGGGPEDPGPGAQDAGVAADASAADAAPRPPPPEERLLEAGEELRPNESRSAYGGRFTLAYQGDGNLVLYEGTSALWSSRTPGTAAYLTAMQGDGNLVVYARGDEPVFASGTQGHPGAALFVLQSGALQIRGRDGRVLWDAMMAE
jgi:hypothetical protein